MPKIIEKGELVRKPATPKERVMDDETTIHILVLLMTRYDLGPNEAGALLAKVDTLAEALKVGE